MILFDYGQTLVQEQKFNSKAGYEAVLQYAVKNAADKLSGFVFIFLVIVTCIVTMWAEYLLPCLARFNNTITQTLHSCALIALMNIPASVLQLVILAATALAVLIYPLAIVVVPAGGTLLNCYILERIFVKYMSAEDRKKEELLEPEKGS